MSTQSHLPPPPPPPSPTPFAPPPAPPPPAHGTDGDGFQRQGLQRQNRLPSTSQRQNQEKGRGRKPVNIVVGKKVVDGLVSWRGADLTTEIYIGNVSVDVSVDDARRNIQERGVEVIELEVLGRHHHFQSFRLRLRKTDLATLKNPDIWPCGIVIRHYFRGKCEGGGRSSNNNNIQVFASGGASAGGGGSRLYSNVNNMTSSNGVSTSASGGGGGRIGALVNNVSSDGVAISPSL